MFKTRDTVQCSLVILLSDFYIEQLWNIELAKGPYLYSRVQYEQLWNEEGDVYTTQDVIHACNSIASYEFWNIGSFLLMQTWCLQKGFLSVKTPTSTEEDL